jgi:hypothetical protein
MTEPLSTEIFRSQFTEEKPLRRINRRKRSLRFSWNDILGINCAQDVEVE